MIFNVVIVAGFSSSNAIDCNAMFTMEYLHYIIKSSILVGHKSLFVNLL